MKALVLANDGISPSGSKALEAADFSVSTENVPQDQLIDHINKHQVEVLLVRSATTVRKDLIDACPGLRGIGRGGVGMDNIDVEYARSKGIKVFNTPASSSISVAEMVTGQLFTMVRSLHDSNRKMPEHGATEFKALKKAYGKGTELRGKTLGIIGFGRIGRWTARYAIGCGMHVIAVDKGVGVHSLTVPLNGSSVKIEVELVTLDELLAKSDAISLHVPAQPDGSSVIGQAELDKCKDGVFIVNTARGGSIDEDALLHALNTGKVRAAALDVFTSEPTPRQDLLAHPNISLTPHIGAATMEAQDRIGEELAENIIELYTEAEA
jgi:D-3-phosphoglycerate dehydrogenase